MKNAIIYAVIFIIAFGATTFGIYNYNSKYANMFELDFRDAAAVAIADSIALADSLGLHSSDSLALSDSLLAMNKHEDQTNELKEEVSETKNQLNKTSSELSKKEKELEVLKQKLDNKKIAQHESWLKSTIKLYEAMEVGKAGDLLKSLPESEAREIIYSMKNKKAAEILSSLDTETVKRLTRKKNDI